jgi:uncharacterized protein (TIGR02444 family)
VNANGRAVKKPTIPDRSRADDTNGLQYDNEFWRFSLAIYGQAEVTEECLALQKAIGIDVNLLLFCAWLGTRAVALTDKDIEKISAAVAGWHESVVRPLRGVRQWMKALNRDELENLRERVKDIELGAEQIEQAVLFAHSKRIQGRVGADRHEAITRNVNQYLKTKTPERASQRSAPCLIDAAQHMP